MNDAVVGATDQRRFGFRHRGERRGAIAGGNRFFDLTNRRAHPRTPPLVDRSAAGDLTRGFFGGFGIGHKVWTQAVREREARLIGGQAVSVNVALPLPRPGLPCALAGPLWALAGRFNRV